MFSKHCFFFGNLVVFKAQSCHLRKPKDLDEKMVQTINFFLEITWYWFGPHCFEGRTRAVRSSAVFEYRLPTLKLSFLIMFFYLSFCTLLFFNLDSFSHLDDSKDGQSHHCAASDQISHHLGSSISHGNTTC